jgi:diguanylate cyclase (GGDEF)-like protein
MASSGRDTRPMVALMVAGGVLSAATLLVPGYVRPTWWAHAAYLAITVGTLVGAAAVARFGANAGAVLGAALAGDLTTASLVPTVADPHAATPLIAGAAVSTVYVALFGSRSALLVQVLAAAAANSVILAAAGDPIPGRWIHLAVATYATAGVAVVVQVLRRRLDQAIASERDLATTDALTGVANRRGLTSRAAGLAGKAVEHGASIGALVADLDHFKEVNDRYGHAEGDRVLVGATDAIRECLHSADVVCRLGGEEFAIVTTFTTPADLADLAERIRLRVAHACTAWSVTVSIGAAWAPTPERHESPGGADGAAEYLWSLVDAADDLMFAAKRAGRNRTMIQAGDTPATEPSQDRPSRKRRTRSWSRIGVADEHPASERRTRPHPP